LILLYRRIERKINKMMGEVTPTADNVLAKLEQERGKYISKENYERIQKFLVNFKEIKENHLEIVDEEEFNEVFFEMSWFADII